MLGIRNYSKDYVDACRSKVEADVSTFTKFLATARKQAGTHGSEVDGLESTFFNNMVLMLDYLFVHRLRTVEGKNGNPLNEVRVLCNSMLENNGVLTPDKSISLSPEKSVLKYHFGDEIKVNEGDFLLISRAFFAEIEAKFV